MARTATTRTDAAARNAPSAAWRGGWLQGAQRCASPHHGPRPAGACIDLLVVHSISLPPGSHDALAVDQLFCGTLDWDAHPYYQAMRGLQVSAHFFIERSGRLRQYVDCDRRAWHAGASHWRGRDGCNDDSIGVELHGLEGERFEDAQYRRLAWLVRALMQRYPLRFVAGHEHIAPGRKGDPGAGFDWQRLQGGFAGSGLYFPPHR